MNKKDRAYIQYMDPKRIVMLVVGASVMVLIFSAILVPIIGDANESLTAKTYTNTGFMDMDKMSYLETDYKITYSVDTNGHNIATIEFGNSTATIDGANYNFDPRIMLFDEGRIGITHTINSVSTGYVDMFEASNSTVSMKNGGTVEYDHSANTITVINQPDAEPVTYSANHVIACVENGTYVQVNSNEFSQKYFTESLAESGKLGYFWGSISYNNKTYHITVSEGEIYSVQLDADEIDWTGTVSIVGSPTLVSGTTDIYTGGAPSVVITINDTDYTASVTYSAILKEIPGHTTDTPLVSMLNVLPIVAMIGIILAVVGVAIIGRNDY